MTNAELARAVAEAARYSITFDGPRFIVHIDSYRPYEDLNQAFAAADRVLPDWSIQSWQPFDGGAREYICQGFSKDGKEQSGAGNNPARAICLAIVEATK